MFINKQINFKYSSSNFEFLFQSTIKKNWATIATTIRKAMYNYENNLATRQAGDKRRRRRRLTPNLSAPIDHIHI